MRRGASACGFCRFRKRRHSRGRSHAYTRLRLASGSVARTRALNAPQRRTLSLVFSYAAHPVGEPPMAAYEKRHPKVSFAVVVGLNRAADCVTARASNECVGGAYACGFCRFRKRRHSRRRTRGHLVRWKEKDICPQVFAIFPTITKRRRASRLLFVMVGLNRLELSTSRLSGVCSNQLSYNPLVPLSGGLWWRCTDSNRGPLECKSSALPTELHPRGECLKMIAPA